MSDEIQTTDTSGVPASGVSPSPSEAPASETPKPSMFDSMDRIGSEILSREPVRGPDGKFQPKVVAPGAPEGGVEVPGGPQAAQTPDPQPVVIEAPQSLPDDVKKVWPSLPPEHQRWLASREGEVHKKFTTDGERLKALSGYEEVLAPYQERLKQVGAPPTEYVRRLAEADKLLASDPQRGILEVARMYGINLGQLAQPGSQPDPNSAVARELSQVKAQLQAIQQDAEGAKLKAAEKVIEAARKDMPHYEAVEPLMVKLFDPSLDLKDLYTMAVRAHPEVSAKVEAEAKEAAEKKAADEAKEKAAKDAKLASQARRPGSAPTGPLKGKNMWDTLDKVGREVVARG
jgi:hypothetical protein